MAYALALAACGGGGGREGALGADTTAADSPAAPAPPPAANAPDGQPATLTVPMQAFNGSGITGTARLVARGEDSTTVTITLRGPGSGTHPGHIHAYSCDDPGLAALPLQSVTMAGGTGTSTTVVGVPLDRLINVPHALNFHAGTGEDPLAAVACGAIPVQFPR